ncbi:MAG: alanine--glyoxylate aminotransferase family protein [Acidobacteria bacterium]|nr:MAG: alanine--glyoxylate aminotransferase family protein [Acidobacteriota bacterium]
MSDPAFRPPRRTLLGPGPSGVLPEALEALALPALGHLDPDFLELAGRVRDLLRPLFGTENELTFAVSGTGTAGMECCLLNLLEPGDRAVVGVHGYFGRRMADIAWRAGAEVFEVSSPWGEPLDAAAMAEVIAERRPKLVAFVHAETSTGVLQDPAPIARAAREAGALVVLDCVTSLGGLPLAIDEWGIDAAYAASQKCLGAPSGLAPVTFGPRALEAYFERKTAPRSFYLDLGPLRHYWDPPHGYHHTASSHLFYALHAALQAVHAEGIAARAARLERLHRGLVAGLEALGLEIPVAREHRLPMLTPVLVPEGIDERDVRAELLSRHGIEIGGGLGNLAGRAWRIGLMGASACERAVVELLDALDGALAARLGRPRRGAADAARARLG